MAKGKEKADLLENSDILRGKLAGAEYWLENHPKAVWGTVGGIALIAVLFFGARYYLSSQNETAQKEMFQAIRYFEADSLKLALRGDGNNLGFEQVISDFPFTDASNLAHYYAGFIHLKQGEFKEAIDNLTSFSANDLLVQARAYCLTGDAYMEQKEFEKAASFYSKAANFKPNKQFSPVYWLKAALAYEKLNKTDDAAEAYQAIIDQYSDSQEAQAAKKYKARLGK